MNAVQLLFHLADVSCHTYSWIVHHPGLLTLRRRRELQGTGILYRQEHLYIYCRSSSGGSWDAHCFLMTWDQYVGLIFSMDELHTTTGVAIIISCFVLLSTDSIVAIPEGDRTMLYPQKWPLYYWSQGVTWSAEPGLECDTLYGDHLSRCLVSSGRRWRRTEIHGPANMARIMLWLEL